MSTVKNSEWFLIIAIIHDCTWEFSRDTGNAGTPGTPLLYHLLHRLALGPQNVKTDSHRDEECQGIVHEHVGTIIDSLE